MSNGPESSRPPVVRDQTQSSPDVPGRHASQAAETSGHGTYINGDQIHNITAEHRWWIVILVVLSITATAVVGGICGTGHCNTSAKNIGQSAGSTSTSIPTNTQQSSISTLQRSSFTATPTSTPPTPTTSSQSASSTSAAASSTQSSACIGGTGKDNYLGLCDFSCHYHYCPGPPYGPCTCTAWGAATTPQPTVAINGVPAPGEDESYEGLCSYVCAHGYCPPNACVAT
ncbi:hypothetical protein BDZ45DRAFT_755006 [Acephala macrosclerotiorum]|nr:hypothetical protein BDZ45DRAFT_755006 [Acephala macrosclerotiorum]